MCAQVLAKLQGPNTTLQATRQAQFPGLQEFRPITESVCRERSASFAPFCWRPDNSSAYVVWSLIRNATDVLNASSPSPAGYILVAEVATIVINKAVDEACAKTKGGKSYLVAAEPSPSPSAPSCAALPVGAACTFARVPVPRYALLITCSRLNPHVQAWRTACCCCNSSS